MYLHSLIQAAYDSSLYTKILSEKEKLRLETSKNTGRRYGNPKITEMTLGILQINLS